MISFHFSPGFCYIQGERCSANTIIAHDGLTLEQCVLECVNLQECMVGVYKYSIIKCVLKYACSDPILDDDVVSFIKQSGKISHSSL